jgi:hypothetical protein
MIAIRVLLLVVISLLSVAFFQLLQSYLQRRRCRCGGGSNCKVARNKHELVQQRAAHTIR